MVVQNLGIHRVGAGPILIGTTTQNVLFCKPVPSNGTIPYNWSLLAMETWGIGSYASPFTRIFIYGGPLGNMPDLANSAQLNSPVGVNREIRVFTDRQINVDVEFLSILWSDLVVP